MSDRRSRGAQSNSLSMRCMLAPPTAPSLICSPASSPMAVRSPVPKGLRHLSPVQGTEVLPFHLSLFPPPPHSASLGCPTYRPPVLPVSAQEWGCPSRSGSLPPSSHSLTPGTWSPLFSSLLSAHIALPQTCETMGSKHLSRKEGFAQCDFPSVDPKT